MHLGKHFFVYITASKPRGVLYVGMSSDLTGRAFQHRQRLIDGFTKRYWVDRLVYFEPHPDAGSAQRREYLLKRWRREWKIALIERTRHGAIFTSMPSGWTDLNRSPPHPYPTVSGNAGSAARAQAYPGPSPLDITHHLDT